MGSKSKTPKAPNYTALANQQAELAKQQWERELNAARPDQVGPTGSMTWEQSPTGEWTQTTTLTPEQEALRKQSASQQGGMLGLGDKAIAGYDPSQVDFSGAPQMPSAVDYSKLGDMPQAVDYAKELGAMPEVGGYDQRAIDTIRALQQPDLARRRSAQDARLAAMGLSTGSGKAWESAQGAMGDVETRADLNAVLEGLRRGDTMYGQALAGRGQRAGELGQTWQQQMLGRQQGATELDKAFGQGMQTRQQGVNEIINQKAANLQQLSGLTSLGRAYNPAQYTPQFGSTNVAGAGGAATPNLMGAAQSQYQAAVDKANADAASNPWNKIVGIGTSLVGNWLGGPAGGAAMSGLMGLGGGSKITDSSGWSSNATGGYPTW